MPVSRAEIVYESSCKLKCICILIIVTLLVDHAAAAAAAAGGGHGVESKPVKIHQSSKAAAAAATASVQQFPKDPIYSNPWVQQHIALAYAPDTTRDGLGAQALRMLGIYALSKALGVQYLHMQPECVGHIGGLPHYQGQDCSSRMTAADYKALNRVQKVLALPSPQGLSIEALNSSSSGGSGGWFVERLDDVVLTWDALRKAVHSALQQQRSTVIKLARVQALLCHHPDVFLAVPQLRPPVSKQKAPHRKPWLLRSIRVAVHMRRGDITQNVKHLNRLLPLGYYVNVLQRLTKALEAHNHDVVIECYTERPTSPTSRKELASLRSTFPSISLLIDTDDLWNWQQMATADILVLSLSTYSVVPSLLNPNALIIGPKPTGLDGSPMSVLRMRHWHSTLDHNGTLPATVLQQVRQRFGKEHSRPKQLAAAAALGPAAAKAAVTKAT